MQSKCFAPAARVHICLGLHTMGYQQELAVTMEAGKRIPLTPTQVAAETGLKKQNVRPAMLELQLDTAEFRSSFMPDRTITPRPACLPDGAMRKQERSACQGRMAWVHVRTFRYNHRAECRRGVLGGA
jgi:hypothetical protein